MNILVIGFDWKGKLDTDPDFMLRKLGRDRLDPAHNQIVLWEFSTKRGDRQIAPSVRALTRRASFSQFRPLYDFLAWRFIVRDMRRIGFKPDVVVLNDFPLLPAARRVKQTFGSKILLYLTNLPTDLSRTRRGGFFKAAYHRLFQAGTARSLDTIAVISEATHAYARSLGIPEEHIFPHVPDVIGPNKARIAQVRKESMRERFHIAADTHVLISVGRLEGEKGFDRLLHAVAALKRTDVALVILGEGRLRSQLEALARTLGISERVHFAGHITRRDIWDYYADADAFVLLSRSEGLGLVVWEAMYMRVPVIVSGAGGLAESVGANGERGFLWKEGENISVFSTELDRCFDRDAIGPMLERAHAYVEQRIAHSASPLDSI